MYTGPPLVLSIEEHTYTPGARAKSSARSKTCASPPRRRPHARAHAVGMSSEPQQPPGQSGQLRGAQQEGRESLDEEWEELSRSGCPDFMLFSRAVNGFVQSLPAIVGPYVPSAVRPYLKALAPAAGGARGGPAAPSGRAPAAAAGQVDSAVGGQPGGGEGRAARLAAHQQQQQSASEAGGSGEQPHPDAPSAAGGDAAPAAGCGPPLKGLLACGVCAAPHAGGGCLHRSESRDAPPAAAGRAL
ncbi:hypothetical protein Rsub_09524 [Raphidocelis subcapitata]|uniref:Uncharacterized protein n=1 Tax=Raphidocelis subcapitata TaxID=307507 RepID=A0A2V0PB17_9CHLO|nr:hypothetical protein Rsub_09524 [Raphidocelis subcapitata]|eukprot:GBF97051.1 hypothetical protein Rsub_09524 [Raphidocelis subcapitata]